MAASGFLLRRFLLDQLLQLPIGNLDVCLGLPGDDHQDADAQSQQVPNQVIADLGHFLSGISRANRFS